MKNILIYDIETSPIVTEGWSMWQEPVRLIEDWNIICFAYKWLGEKQTHFIANWHHTKNPKNDKKTATAIRDLFDEADIVIAHNGDKFDQKKSKARFLYHNLIPPSPYRSIDTLKVAKKEFALTSNRLDDIAKFLGLDGKLEHEGFMKMWDGIKAHNPKTQANMKKYNLQDVNLLEQVYLRLRPYTSNHPNLTVIAEEQGCPKCLSNNIYKRGFVFTNTGQYQRYQCKECGGWFQDRCMDKSEFKCHYK